MRSLRGLRNSLTHPFGHSVACCSASRAAICHGRHPMADNMARRTSIPSPLMPNHGEIPWSYVAPRSTPSRLPRRIPPRTPPPPVGSHQQVGHPSTMLEELNTPCTGRRWVCRLAHHGCGDRAVRAIPCWLAWASPAEFTTGPSQCIEASGQKPARNCAPYSGFSFSFTIPEIHINFKNM
jgi:hypothetical protein